MTLRVRVLPGVDSVRAAEWDTLAGDRDPFVEHRFLATLERSGSVGIGTGWMPVPLLAEREAAPGRWTPVGAVPLYAKSHGWGEFIFDWGWADAARRAGIPYYPKLVAAVPFTPATGPRILVAPGEDRGEVTTALAVAARDLARSAGASSVHVLFCTAGESADLGAAGLLPRLSHQYHWQDRGWRDFDDFLAALTHKRRNEARRERRRALAGGVEIRVVRGEELTAEDVTALHGYYCDTAARHGATPYLAAGFWRDLRGVLATRVVAILAWKGGERVAGALFFEGGDTLFGRYWGCREDLRALHFEVCYYRPIEYALERGLRRFEAGAQGEHKVQRGLVPAFTHSAHWIAHPDLADAVARHVRREAEHVRAVVAESSRHTPYRREPETSVGPARDGSAT